MSQMNALGVVSESGVDCTRDIESILQSWVNRCQAARDKHYKQSEFLFKVTDWSGLILLYSTIFVTVMSFFQYNIENEPILIFMDQIKLQKFIIFISVIAAITSGITSQSRFGERAEMHRSSGARYANLSRKIESLSIKMSLGKDSNEVMRKEIDNIITEWNNISEDSPLTPHNNTRIQKWALSFVFLVLSSLLLYSINKSV